MDLKDKNVYISGPITGKLLHNAPAFAEAHAMLREMGAAEVLNPTGWWLSNDGPERAHEDYMIWGLRQMVRPRVGDTRPFYDAIVLLDGFENSAGARVEVEVAEAIGIPSIKMGDLRNFWSNREEKK